MVAMRSRLIVPLFLLFGSLLVAQACSGKSEESSGTATDAATGQSAVSADQAATDAASAFCNKVSSCVPTFVQIQWGDAGTCSSKFTALLKGTLAATGTSANPADMEQCAQAIPAASCDDVLGRNLPEPCRPEAGTLADGAACGDNAQCKGKLCKIAPQRICGVCSTPAAAGAVCGSDDECDLGLKCAGTPPVLRHARRRGWCLRREPPLRLFARL
jgi:hypothetical protein